MTFIKQTLLITSSLLLVSCQNLPPLINNKNADTNTKIETIFKLPKPQPVLTLDRETGILFDRLTYIEWNMCAIGSSWNIKNQKCTGQSEKMMWMTTIDFIKQSNIETKRNWRLPSQEDIETLNEHLKQTDLLNKIDTPDIWLTRKNVYIQNINCTSKCILQEDNERAHNTLLIKNGDISKEWKIILSN